MKRTNGNTELTNTALSLDKEEVRALVRKYGLVKGLKMVKLTIANRNLNKE